MERRKFVLGLGSLAAGGAAAMGTGAFSVDAQNRSFSADVVGDANAYLALDGSNSPYAQTSGSKLQISLDGNGNGGSGLNRDSVTTIDKLFQVRNQGTGPVDVSISLDDFSGQISPYFQQDRSVGSVRLSVGESVWVGAEIDVPDSGSSYDGTFDVVATKAGEE